MKRDWTKATEMMIREAVMFRGFDKSIMGIFGQQQQQQQSKEAPQSKQKPQQKSLSDLLGIPTDARRT